MKKRIIALAAALTVFTACAPAYPSAEEMLKGMESGESGIAPARTVIYTAETDPDGLLGKEHSYTGKAGIYDSREDAQEGNRVYIEIFDNAKDAEIRRAYFETVNDCISAFTEENGFTVNGSPVFREVQIHQNGNTVIHTDQTVEEGTAEKYFAALDAFLGTKEYRQKNVPEKAEFEALYKANTEDARSTIEARLAKDAEEYRSEVNDEVKAQLKKCAENPDDETMNETSKMIKVTYSGQYFDTLRKAWQEEFDTLKEQKEKNEAEWRETVQSIEAMIADALNNPDRQKYDDLNTAIAAVPDNYFFAKYTEGWKKSLEELDEKIILIERDNNVSAMNAKLDELEKTHSPSLYDELREQTGDYSRDSLYNDYVEGWRQRLAGVKDAVETERKKAEIQAFKDSCKSISYKEFSRNSDQYIGTPVYFKGEVIQVVDQDSKGATMRVNVTATGTYSTWYTDTIYVEYDSTGELSVTKILEDDIIEIWGLGAGDVSYTSVLGAKVTIPAVYAKYVKVK